MTLLTRRYTLSLTHIVSDDNVSDTSSNLHGHTFKVDVTLSGEPLPPTFQVISRITLDQIFNEKIALRFDKKRVNDQLAHGTGEVIAKEFLDILRATDLKDSVVSVQLVETRKNRFQGLYSLK